MLHQIREDGRAVSFFGDLHPSFAGNVVKAMGGVKQGWPVVAGALAGLAQSASPEDPAAFIAAHEPSPAPPCGGGESPDAHHRRGGGAGARRPRAISIPASSTACRISRRWPTASTDTTLAMEGLALTGAWTEPESGLVGTIVLEMGGSSDLCMLLKPGEPVILMGPTGTPTETPAGETVLLAGGGLGNAVLFSIGRAFKRRRLARALLRRLQAPAGPLQGGGDRGRGRCRGLGLGRGAGLHPRPAAGQGDRRQYRARP